MVKKSTFQLIFSNYFSHSEKELKELQIVSDFYDEFHDVFKELNKYRFDVRQGIVDSLLNQTEEIRRS